MANLGAYTDEIIERGISHDYDYARLSYGSDFSAYTSNCEGFMTTERETLRGSCDIVFLLCYMIL